MLEIILNNCETEKRWQWERKHWFSYGKGQASKCLIIDDTGFPKISQGGLTGFAENENNVLNAAPKGVSRFRAYYYYNYLNYSCELRNSYLYL